MGLILGIDPGSQCTGYGFVEEVHGSLRCVAFGVLEGGEQKYPHRLLKIGLGLAAVLKEYAPSAVVLEKTFFAKNADSAMKLGQARGVCLYEAAKFQVPIFEYNPTEVKASLVGHGRADKEQVQFMVRTLLSLPPLQKFDMSDALALAIHHARVDSTMRQIKEREVMT